MKFRYWLNAITFILLAALIFVGWNSIVEAWHVMWTANLWILSLMIPAQIFSYYAIGEIFFSYLRSKGDLHSMTQWQMTRLALEMNFVNHVLPSGGAAGFPYASWVLGRHGIKASRSTMAQIVRYMMSFAGFVVLLIASVLYLILTNNISQSTLILCGLMIFIVVVCSAVFVVIFGNRARMLRFAKWITRIANKIVNFFTRGRKNNVVDLMTIESFFEELHKDYIGIKREKKVLFVPFIWGVIAHAFDVILILIVFISLGYWVDPAVLYIAFGLSVVFSAFSGMIGGTGVYEAVMVSYLASTGVSADVAIAGTLLARIILLLGTILFGYSFYHMTINKYGKAPSEADIQRQ